MLLQRDKAISQSVKTLLSPRMSWVLARPSVPFPLVRTINYKHYYDINHIKIELSFNSLVPSKAAKPPDLARSLLVLDFSPGEKSPGTRSWFLRLSTGFPWFLEFFQVEY